MNTDTIVFAEATLAGKTLHEMYPDAKHISLVEHGYDNIVGLVDETYAVRFPRNANAYKRSQYEKAVLNSLKELHGITVPKVLGERANPPCLITSFVPGTHLSSREVNDLSPEMQQAFGKQVAQFAYALHVSLSVAEARKFRKDLGLDELAEEPWDEYFEKTLMKTTLPAKQQDSLAKHYFDLWKHYDTKEGLVVVHDDLHTENMLFKDGRLIGILDFGDTNIGTPEQELRQLYRINERVLRVAIETYGKLSGRQLNIQAIKTWAIMQELAAYAKHMMAKNTEHPAFGRACRNLNTWLPEGGWGSGFALSHEASSLQ